MSSSRFLLAALFLLGLCWQADAATCFWVGGTASWTHANAASWASATGGTASTCAATGGIPDNAGDQPTFDANSGGGTVTVNDASITTGILVLTGFAGTLDFSANNNSLSLTGISDSSGTHTLNMGSGTWSMTTAASSGTIVSVNNASLTLNGNTSTLAINLTGTCAASLTFSFGSKTFATVSMTTTAGSCLLVSNQAATFGHLILTGPITVAFENAITTTISNAYTWTGTSSNPIGVISASEGAAATISTPAGSTGTWMAIRDITFSSNTPTFSNCLNLGHISGVTCSAPNVVAGGGGGLIGGGF